MFCQENSGNFFFFNKKTNCRKHINIHKRNTNNEYKTIRIEKYKKNLSKHIETKNNMKRSTNKQQNKRIELVFLSETFEQVESIDLKIVPNNNNNNGKHNELNDTHIPIVSFGS
jgi:glutaredoxin-related protein